MKVYRLSGHNEDVIKEYLKRLDDGEEIPSEIIDRLNLMSLEAIYNHLHEFRRMQKDREESDLRVLSGLNDMGDNLKQILLSISKAILYLERKEGIKEYMRKEYIVPIIVAIVTGLLSRL